MVWSCRRVHVVSFFFNIEYRNPHSMNMFFILLLIFFILLLYLTLSTALCLPPFSSSLASPIRAATAGELGSVI